MVATAQVRLSDDEIDAIKTAFAEVFGEGKVMLFGSRVNLKAKGGDIDLYLIPKNKENLRQKRINFLIQLDLKIGERKIDVILEKNPNRLIEQEALNKGVFL